MTTIRINVPQFEEAVKHMKNELANIRTGRAHPALVENLKIDYYGTMTPLIQIASINVPDAHSLVVQPWDQNAIKNVEKAIIASDLGLNPVNEGNTIRIPIPPLTEERRAELVKRMYEKVESARVSIRTIRENIWKEIKEAKNAGDITEDDLYQHQKELQEVVDRQNEIIKGIADTKEKEIMTI